MLFKTKEKELEVRITKAPCTPLGRETMENTIWVPYSIAPDDFLSQIMKILHIDHGTTNLGWRSCDDSKISNPCPLMTTRDAKRLLNEMSFLRNARERRSIKKSIWVQVIDLVRKHSQIPLRKLTHNLNKRVPQLIFPLQISPFDDATVVYHYISTPRILRGLNLRIK